jgi:hypothetical protein
VCSMTISGICSLKVRVAVENGIADRSLRECNVSMSWKDTGDPAKADWVWNVKAGLTGLAELVGGDGY